MVGFICKCYEKAKKKLTILEAPNILTIALKRFQSGKFGKLNKAVRLYGVVVHLDIMNAAFLGPYLCYVKNAQNKWFKIDDNMAKNATLKHKMLSLKIFTQFHLLMFSLHVTH
ncbi:hypothetical protein GOBAR_DD30681 [Gossypium barbadense]|nr:hypothetical protein GOBAR_DD30681 [Gossypium barbadense]